MPSHKIAWQHFLCYRVRREYVAGHNKLTLDLHGVSGSDTPGRAHHENPTKARITRKDTRNA